MGKYLITIEKQSDDAFGTQKVVYGIEHGHNAREAIMNSNAKFDADNATAYELKEGGEELTLALPVS